MPSLRGATASIRAKLVGHPIDLAVLRICVFAMLLATRDLRTAPGFAALSPSLRTPPEGLHALASLLPISVPIANAVLAVIVVASVLALVGCYTRLAATVAALGLVYLLGIPQLYGTVRHYHHFVWLAAILAASPCGDALSIDALRATRRDGLRPLPSIAHGIPLRATWVMLACIYFFAGYWKWKESGLAWATSDNLVQQMRWKWLQNGHAPSLRLDLHPQLSSCLAFLTMSFEVLFPFALLHKHTRALALVGALVFHVATAYFMSIYFGSLLCLYAAFVPWHRLIRTPTPTASCGRSSVRPFILASAILVGIVQAGVRGATQAWPFACYPTFQWIVPDEMPVLELDAEEGGGHTITLDDRPTLAARDPIDRQRRWALGWSLARDPRPDAIEAWVALARQRDQRLREAVSIRVYRAMRAVDPAAWTDPARSRTLLYEWRATSSR